MLRLLASGLLLLSARQHPTRTFPLHGADLADSAAMARSLPRLAGEVMALPVVPGNPEALDDLFRLQIVAGRYDAAARTLAALHRLHAGRAGAAAADTALNVQYQIFVEAARRSAAGTPFATAFARTFRTWFSRLTDRTGALVIRALSYTPSDFAPALSAAVSRQQGRDTISLADALTLLRAYQETVTYRRLAPLVGPLVRDDDRRRYRIELNVPVRMADGATICAWIVRPRAAPKRRPTLLMFTIYADSASTFGELRRSASNGYAAVAGFTRGKMCSPDKPVPYVHDGSDGAALVDWIAGRPWSDGRVGMYGGSYVGFTPWAVAKHLPDGLKAIMTGAPNAPGIDSPMEGNVFWNFLYPWPFFTTDNKALDNATYSDAARWARLDRAWYTSGRAYRDLDRIDGTPNPVWDEWLTHPSYDAYWQAMIPYGAEFARVRIPVLQTAGYYFGGPGAAAYYFREHHKFDPGAQDYLVIGPYDHFQAQRGVVSALGDTTTTIAGYETDPVARIDLVADLRYQWFDFVLRGGPRPALLRDMVNYEVTGANVWKHAPSLAAMADGAVRYHLTTDRVGGAYGLGTQAPATDSAIAQTVDLTDRSDVDRQPVGGGVADSAVDTTNAIEFVSEPLAHPTELSGQFSGRLDFVTNKKDFDFSIGLFELTPEGRYLQLSTYWARASYVGGPDQRRLLSPGTRQRLDFTALRLMSRRCQAGSRIVVVLGVIKNPGQQVNYGSGKDVSDETIADAGPPLSIRWSTSSYIDLPVSR